MNRDEQLERWLNGTLSAEEKAAFEKSRDFQTLQKITQALEAYRAPEYATQEEFARLQEAKLSRPAGKSATLWLKPVLRISAILVLVAGAYFIFFSNRATTVTALVAERKEVNLPDQSEVTLNAASAITYSGSSWKEKRVVAGAALAHHARLRVLEHAVAAGRRWTTSSPTIAATISSACSCASTTRI